jgi:hypothetical protein
MVMGIELEKFNGDHMVKLTEEINSECMKKILDETHACMRIISLEDNPKVIFDRSIEEKCLSVEKKELINELNDFLVNRCERVAILFSSHQEKVKYNYRSYKRGRSLNVKGFTNNEIERAKEYLGY